MRELRFRKLEGFIIRYLIPEGIPGFAADLYDRAARTAITGYYREVAEEIVAKIDCGSILDIGTGPGYLPLEIARRKPNIRICGIDLSKRMIEIARRNAEEADLTARLSFEVGNANQLRFADNTYDLIISSGVLHSWKDPLRVLNECYRALKPGGEAWIYDPARILAPENIRSWQESLKGFERVIYRWLAFISKIRPGVQGVNIQEIIAKTNFKEYEIKGNGGLSIKLRK